MHKRPVMVALVSADGGEVRGEGELIEIPFGTRVVRAVGIFVVAMLASVALIPIPIIHLMGPPLLLIGGGIAAGRQLRAVARLTPIRLACPKCQAVNRIGGGLGMIHPDQPLEISCDSCRRGLTVTLERG
ncbi:MAG: hypothetical protein IPO52_06290 [Gemmatimonadetes bacterium]|nr:hypothetical protein [Gemmatimonadota bacterium]